MHAHLLHHLTVLTVPNCRWASYCTTVHWPYTECATAENRLCSSQTAAPNLPCCGGYNCNELQCQDHWLANRTTTFQKHSTPSMFQLVARQRLVHSFSYPVRKAKHLQNCPSHQNMMQ
ncbi:hypothetical protein COO60DRAFT_534025 [Scenedesmus sp. NREL 46B-D3]|nr:hypothetical protein COO60DRAFT_534025 [Scenedesmus sp. NREL 46B-D3]